MMYDLQRTQEQLDKISPSMCLAKWLQVTLHLQFGHKHSCHHPGTHTIPVRDLTTPSSLHNTTRSFDHRTEMLSGKRPTECEYCWKMEDANQLSDRIVKSAEMYSSLDRIPQSSATNHINPTHVEVSFSHHCNLKCIYCAPHISSTWEKEIKRHGPYPTSEDFNSLDLLKLKNIAPYGIHDDNPYVTAFWEWWPNLRNDLKVFRITGGEPFLHKSTFKVFDDIIDNPVPEMEFSINTNLMIKNEAKIEQICDLINSVRHNVKEFKIYTSVDNIKKQAEYIRTGLDYNIWVRNVEMILERCKGIQIVVMCAFNALSVTGIESLLEQIMAWRFKYADRGWYAPVVIDTPLLNNPKHLSLDVLPKKFALPYLENALQFMCVKRDSYNFLDEEIVKFRRIVEYYRTSSMPDWVVRCIDFYRYFDEHDNRNNTNFLETFPEYKPFWLNCKYLANRIC